MFFAFNIPAKRERRPRGTEDKSTQSPSDSTAAKDNQLEYIGLYVVAYHQVVETQTLHWGVFFGRSLHFPGELHHYIPAMRGHYQYTVDDYHTPRGGSGLRYVAAHRVGEIPADGNAYFKLFVDDMELKAGWNGQDWTHAALDILEKSKTGWIDTERRLVLENHLPRRQDPEKEYISTRGTVCDLEQLDTTDFLRYETLPSTSNDTASDSLQKRLESL